MGTAKKSIPLRFYQKRSHKVGQSPGTLTIVGEKPEKPCGVTLMDYDRGKCEKQQIETLSELQQLKDNSTNSWINVESITDTNIVAEIGQIFDIHPLVLEDIVNPEQRIKIEVYDDYIFIVLKMITYSEEIGELYKVRYPEKQETMLNHVHVEIRKAGTKDRVEPILLDLATMEAG